MNAINNPLDNNDNNRVKKSYPDKLFMYRGKNVEELSHAEAIDALKMCIHDLEQERRYKHPDVTEARIRLADGDFLGKEESERIMGEILSKTPEGK